MNETLSARKTKQNRQINVFIQIVIFVAKNRLLLKINKYNFNNIWNNQFKRNKIVNRFLLTGDKFMSKSHVRQPGFIYGTCGPFTKHRGRIPKFQKNG